MTPPIGLSANADGAHTRELLDGFAAACDWLGASPAHHWADDGRDPLRARRAAAEMARRGVPLVIGHLSAAASVAAAGTYRAGDIALLAPATSHPGLNPSNWPGILRVCGTDAGTAAAMVAALPPAGGVLVLCQRQRYGLSLGRALRTQLGAAGRRFELRVLGDAVPPPLPRGTRSVLICGIHEFCADLLRALPPGRAPLHVGLGDDCLTPNFPRLAGPAADAVRISGPVVPGVANPAALGYLPACTIAACIGLQALRAAPEARGAALGRIMRARRWSTPYGPVSFDRRGDLRGFVDRTFMLAGGAFREAPVAHMAGTA